MTAGQVVSSILNSFFRLFVRLASRLDPRVCFEIHDPQQSPISESFVDELARFRAHAFQKRSPHLAQKFTLQIDNEKTFDMKSIHSIARNRKTGEIIGAVRFTPSPFEFEKYTHIDPPLSAELTHNALEISRLISHTPIPFVGRRLLFIAGAHIWTNTSYRTLMGICRPERLKLFESFGQKNIRSSFWLEERQSHYHIIAGDLDQVITAVRRSFKNRLKEYFLSNKAEVKSG